MKLVTYLWISCLVFALMQGLLLKDYQSANTFVAALTSNVSTKTLKGE